MRLVHNKGVNDYSDMVEINGKIIKSYTVWADVLRRCYNAKFQEKNPTYIGCSVCDEWLYFSKFKEWFDKNYRWDIDAIGLKPSLDKDLLIEENKVYSPSACCFLPHRINSFIRDCKPGTRNTSGYLGVCWSKRYNKWRAIIKDFGTRKQKYLGRFTSIEDASETYQHARTIEALRAKEYLRSLGYSEEIINKIK